MSSPCKCKRRKKEAYTFLHELYTFLKERSDLIILKKTRGMEGRYEPPDDEIVIDYRKEFIPTLIHEVMHCLHPQWCETKVAIKEREIINAITLRQCKNIIKVFASYL